MENFKLDVADNEEEVIAFLNSHNIFERGNILSPAKEIWFKFSHYIQLQHAWCYLDKEQKNIGNWYYYRYVTKNQQLQGKLLDTITFEELKGLKTFNKKL